MPNNVNNNPNFGSVSIAGQTNEKSVPAFEDRIKKLSDQEKEDLWSGIELLTGALEKIFKNIENFDDKEILKSLTFRNGSIDELRGFEPCIYETLEKLLVVSDSKEENIQQIVDLKKFLQSLKQEYQEKKNKEMSEMKRDMEILSRFNSQFVINNMGDPPKINKISAAEQAILERASVQDGDTLFPVHENHSKENKRINLFIENINNETVFVIDMDDDSSEDRLLELQEEFKRIPPHVFEKLSCESLEKLLLAKENNVGWIMFCDSEAINNDQLSALFKNKEFINVIRKFDADEMDHFIDGIGFILLKNMSKDMRDLVIQSEAFGDYMKKANNHSIKENILISQEILGSLSVEQKKCLVDNQNFNKALNEMTSRLEDANTLLSFLKNGTSLHPFLSDAQMKKLMTGFIWLVSGDGEIKPEKFAYLSKYAPQFVNSLNKEQIGELIKLPKGAGLLTEMGPEELKALFSTPKNPDAFINLVASMAPQEIKNIPAASLETLTPEELAHLSKEFWASIGADQLSKMMKGLVSKDFFKSTGVNRISSECLQAISVEALKAAYVISWINPEKRQEMKGTLQGLWLDFSEPQRGALKTAGFKPEQLAAEKIGV